tara:strand:+ start:784 stop:969 length:186 start_codon:yes stop_codon:yes gene_type:complete
MSQIIKNKIWLDKEVNVKRVEETLDYCGGIKGCYGTRTTKWIGDIKVTMIYIDGEKVWVKV